MKKILFINGHLKSGGVEKSLINLLNNLNYQKYQVDLLLLEDKGDYLDQLPNSVHVIYAPVNNAFGPLLGTIKKCLLKRDYKNMLFRIMIILTRIFGNRAFLYYSKLILEDKQYDVAVGYRSGIATQIAGYGVSAVKRISWWHHGEINVDDSYLKDISTMDTIVVPSNSIKEKMITRFPDIKEKIKTIPNIVSPLQKKKVSLKDKQWMISSLGRLSPEKKFENCLYCACKLKERKIPFSWKIIGEGPEMDRLKKYIAVNELEDYVTLTGNNPNPYFEIGNSDIFVHSSEVESQGLSILEAMCLGIPVVVTKSAGPKEYIKNEVNGILTDTGKNELLEGILKIIENPVLYSRIKENTCLPEQFTSQYIMPLIDNLFN